MSAKFKVVSDTHFNHAKIMEYEYRPFDTLYDMNESIIEKWNSEIDVNDRVLHLGDFAFGNDFELIESICKRLNGRITLILGNHDSFYKLKNIYVNYFKCIGSLSMGQYYFSHEPLHLTAIDPDELKNTDRTSTINVHGHIHSRDSELDSNHINMCFDFVGFDNFIRSFRIK